jgi:L-ascorbate metabolism protein UlaG (beta-lactamase superfamily)
MERIGRPDAHGRGLDVAILPIGDLFTMGPDDALEALRLLKPKVALPNHYDTWPPIAQDAAAWAGAVAAARLATPHVLMPGASFVVK